MTDVQLRLVDEQAAAADAAADEPKVFARSISVPPGAPWDQARAARLEARVGAPLPLAEIEHQLRRLGSWRPGQPARFAAFYVRTADVGQRLTTQALVDARWLEVTFVSRAERERQARRMSIALAAVAVGLVTLLASAAVAISARGTAEGELSSIEQLADAKQKIAGAVELQHRQAGALEAAGVRGRSLSDYLDDLDWAASAKAPGARIQAVHWQRGAMAIEARGDAAPFNPVGRSVTKVDKPLRPGVWLWGVTPAGPGYPARPPAPTPGGEGASAP
jgi:hypothetical protein